jgi:LacI family transcriptional regulator
MATHWSLNQPRIVRVPAPTLHHVAQPAGIDPATACRALDRRTRPLVGAGAARKVLSAADSIGYQPDPIARSPETARTGTVGLVITELSDPLSPPPAPVVRASAAGPAT